MRSLVILGYVALSLIGARWLGGYMNDFEGDGTLKVPYLVWLTCGPLIALSNPHSLFVYLIVTSIVLPLLIFAARPGTIRRVFCLTGALAVWLYAGHWMVAG